MPYPGVKEEDTKYMESCVVKVMKTGKDKSSAIAICKTTLDKKNNTNESSILNSELKEFDNYKQGFIRKTMNMMGVPFNVAQALFELNLIKNNYTY